MCSCGCNTCETKITGPLLTEGKVKSLLSEGLQYHIDKKIPLFETIYRIGSEKHLSLIKEARKMYSRGIIDLCEDDTHLINTHLGEFGMLYEIEIGDKVKASKAYGGLSGTVVDIDKKGSFITVKTKEGNQSYHESDLQVLNKEGESVPLDLPMLEMESELQGYLVADVVDDIIKIIGPEYIKGEIKDGGNKNKIYLQLTDKKFANTVINLLKAGLGIEAKYDTTFGFMPAVSFFSDKVITEAEYQGKDVDLNKPKRGGSKKFYVYVRDPKTKRIKKVSFGAAGGGQNLRVKFKDPKARKAFAARQNCSSKKDRTKAGYWSCNLPRYASLLGLGANMNTFW
jgi:hypothetical protein